MDNASISGMTGAASQSVSHEEGFVYLRFNADNPESLLSDVLEKLGNRVKIFSVRVTAPTLEDVFVHLTGASLKVN